MVKGNNVDMTGKPINTALWTKEAQHRPQYQPAEAQIVEALCWVRQNPKGAAAELKKLLPRFDGHDMRLPDNSLLETTEGDAPVKEAIKFLEKQEPLGAIEQHNYLGLKLTAEDHCKDIGPKGMTSHQGTDGSAPAQRMNRYGKWSGLSGECIWYGEPYGGMDIVLALIVDDGVPDRGHRKVIFTPNYAVVGVCVEDHSSFDSMACIQFATGFVDDDDKCKSRNKGKPLPLDINNTGGGPGLSASPAPATSSRHQPQQQQHHQSKPQSQQQASSPKDSPKEKGSKTTKFFSKLGFGSPKSKDSKSPTNSPSQQEKNSSQRSPSPQFPQSSQKTETQSRPVTQLPPSPPSPPSPPAGGGANATGPICAKCGKGVRGLILKTPKGDMHADCFACSACKRSLNGVQFSMHEGKEFCGPCYQQHCAPKCDKCGKPIVGQYLISKEKKYHKECFKK